MATRSSSPNVDRASQVVLRVLERVGQPTPSTKMVKLVYLVDYAYHQNYGETLSGLEYQWDHYGPNALDHGITTRADALVSQQRLQTTKRPNGHGGETIFYHKLSCPKALRMNEAAEMVIDDIVDQYGKLSIDEVTARSKETLAFATAKRRGTLVMNQSAPGMSSSEDDWESHLSDVERNGTTSLEQMIDEYGLG